MRSFADSKSLGIWASQDAHLYVVYDFFHLNDCLCTEELFLDFSKNRIKRDSL